MTEASTHPDRWQPCPRGELQRMAALLKTRRQRKNSFRVTAAATGLTVALLAAAFIWQRSTTYSEIEPLKMTCDQVRPLLADFAAGRIADARLDASIRQHLDACPPCAAMYRRIVSAQQNASFRQRSGRAMARVVKSNGTTPLMVMSDYLYRVGAAEPVHPRKHSLCL